MACTNDILGRLLSVEGVLRVLQLLLGASVWTIITSKRYEGSAHGALLVAVLFWLLTAAALAVSVLDKHGQLPLLGGARWPLSNLALDAAASALYLVALGILVHQTQKNAYCNLDAYKLPCLYKAYLSAAAFAGLTTLAYLLSAAHRAYRCCTHTPPA